MDRPSNPDASNHRILLTGATGFVGSFVAPVLARCGHPLRLAVRDQGRVDPALASLPNTDVFETGDLADDTPLDEAMQGVQTVVHLAGLGHILSGQPEEDAFMRSNAQATANLAAAAQKAGAKRFIHLSSVAAIAPNSVSIVIDDRTDLSPQTPFARSKRAAEGHVQAFAENREALAVSLRPPLIVGAAARGNWALLQRLAATGLPLPFGLARNRRSVIDLETLANAIAHLCETPPDPGLSGNYLITGSPALALRDVIKALRHGMGRGAGLLPVPTGLLVALGTLAGRRRQMSGLFGELLIDATRFTDTFGFQAPDRVAEAIEQSGRAFLKNRTARRSRH
ncbi:MAG: NAD-dependent epimerase/dehydratase family protein [Alphaproteobacteria bacterium]|nr:NAD-dependent epimerase/dehydratase family protein [Alphaproteobacteria bacterium]